MKNFSSQDIANASTVVQWTDAMEQAFIDTAKGIVEVPQRVHVDRGSNTLLLMPCFGSSYFSTKIVSVFPENLKKKEPLIYGSVVLNDGQTGKPLAVLDGSKLTAMRTAAVGAVAIRYLAPTEASSLGIVGLGIQGFHQALFACQQRPIEKLRILDRSEKVMSRFTDRFMSFYPDIEVISCKSAEELCEQSEILITATGSQRAVVPARGEWWKGKTIIGIGSYKPDMREFPDEIFAHIDQVFVDTPVALVETGDLMEPLKKGLIREGQVIPLSELILERVKRSGETRFFKSVGMAAFDLYGARLVYESLS
ncbi:MAG: ornithine cyclodeaminase family protein [Bacteroidales bacterium]|nr:ornithine cyclodeaminase family protein [Bacteroidales bacterium]